MEVTGRVRMCISELRQGPCVWEVVQYSSECLPLEMRAVVVLQLHWVLAVLVQITVCSSVN